MIFIKIIGLDKYLFLDITTTKSLKLTQKELKFKLISEFKLTQRKSLDIISSLSRITTGVLLNNDGSYSYPEKIEKSISSILLNEDKMLNVNNSSVGEIGNSLDRLPDGTIVL